MTTVDTHLIGQLVAKYLIDSRHVAFRHEDESTIAKLIEKSLDKYGVVPAIEERYLRNLPDWLLEQDDTLLRYAQEPLVEEEE